MSKGRRTEKLAKFSALAGADKLLLLHATVWLALARLMLLLMPFNKLATRLSGERGSSIYQVDPELLERIGYAVRAAAGNVPWRSDCFPQCIAGRMLLKHYGHKSTIHLGVEKKDKDSIAGHAWLTCDGNVVVGGEDLDRYTEMLPL